MMSELLNFVRYEKRYAWLMLSVLLSVVGVQAADESRVRVNFSADWQFHFWDVPGAEQLGLDDSDSTLLDSSFCFINFINAPLLIQFDNERFGMKPGQSKISKMDLPAAGEFTSFILKVLRSERLAACCAQAALFGLRQGFQPKPWCKSLACLTANQQSRQMGGSLKTLRNAHWVELAYSAMRPAVKWC